MARAAKAYATIAELEAAAFNLAAIQEWATQTFEKRMTKVMEHAASRVETAFASAAEKDRSGNLKVTTANQMLALNVAGDVAKVLNEAGYGQAVEAHLGTYNGLVDQARELWSRSGIGFSFEQGDVEALQALADADATYFGRLNVLATAAIEKALVQSVMTGANFQAAATGIREALNAENSPFARHAFTYANDSMLNFSAAMAARRDQQYKPDYYYYAGNLIKTSREWCRRRAGLVWPAYRLKQWEQEDWPGKKPGPILVCRGGWNCKHQWIAVTQAWIKANDLEVEREAPPPVKPLIRRKPPGLEGASVFHGPSTATLQTWQGGLQGIIKPTFIVPPTPQPLPPKRVRKTKPAKEPKPKPAPKEGKDLTPAERLARAEAALTEFARTESAKEGRYGAYAYEDWKQVRKWTAWPNPRPDLTEAIRLHQELCEAKVAHYHSLTYDEKIKARNELVDKMIRTTLDYRKLNKTSLPQLRAEWIDKITRGTAYIPYRLLADLERNGLHVMLNHPHGDNRANFTPGNSKGTINLFPRNYEDTVGHEFAHAIDHFWSSKGKRFNWTDGYWQEGPLQQWVTKKDAKKYREWFEAQKTGGKGTYTNGDGEYWLGHWMNNYEGRIYNQDKSCGTEWWSMNVQRYSEWKRTHLDSGDYEGNVGSAARKRIEREWERAKSHYPELTALIEKLFLKPGEI